MRFVTAQNNPSGRARHSFLSFRFGLLLGGESANRVAGFCVGKAQFIELLQVEPELRARPEVVRQPKGGISGDRALAVQDAGDPVRWNLDELAEFRGAYSESCQLFGEVFPWVNRKSRHIKWDQ